MSTEPQHTYSPVLEPTFSSSGRPGQLSCSVRGGRAGRVAALGFNGATEKTCLNWEGFQACSSKAFGDVYPCFCHNLILSWYKWLKISCPGEYQSWSKYIFGSINNIRECPSRISCLVSVFPLSVLFFCRACCFVSWLNSVCSSSVTKMGKLLSCGNPACKICLVPVLMLHSLFHPPCTLPFLSLSLPFITSFPASPPLWPPGSSARPPLPSTLLAEQDGERQPQHRAVGAGVRGEVCSWEWK